MDSYSIYDTLIEKTVSVIANDGIDKTSTKTITDGTGINESYIYRQFSDKDELLIKSFEKIDIELTNTVKKHIGVIDMSQLDSEARARIMFSTMWNFLTERRDYCLAYRQYFQSPHYWKHSADTHKKRLEPIINHVRGNFKQDANVWMIIFNIFNIVLGFAVMVHNNQMPEDDDYAEHVFRVIYNSVKQYFKDDEGEKKENEESI